MKRIIIYSNDFPPNTGGVSRLTEKIAWNIAEKYGKQYSVEVLTISNQARKFSHPAIKIVSVSPSLKGRTLEAYKYLSEIENKDETIIICGLWWPEGLIAEKAGFKNTFILTHSAEIRPDNTWFRKKIWIPIVASRVLRKASKVIANSAYTAQISAELSPKASVECLPLAVDHLTFTPKLKASTDFHEIKLLTVTRIHLWKGLDTILEALCAIPEPIRNKIRWTIAGKGSDATLFQQMINESPMAGQIEMLGFVPDEQLPELYADADLFLLCTRVDANSSNIEGFGLVFLESQAAGTPVIGTPFGGIPSAIEQGNGGWMIKDAGELTNLLNEILTEPTIIVRQGKLARERVENSFTWDHYINNLTNIIGLK